MEIKRVETSNDCGGYRAPKGHMDTQLYPECEGTETDRNIVKKTMEKRKKAKNNKKASKEVLAKHGWPIVRDKGHQSEGVWEQWLNNKIDDRKFVELMAQLRSMNYTGVSLDPTVRKGISRAIENASRTRNYEEAAVHISSALSAGKLVDESTISNQMESGEIQAEYSEENTQSLSNHDIKLITAQRRKKNELLTDVDLRLFSEAKNKKKSKEWNPNPWAVCNSTVDKDGEPEKFERCVKEVKKQQAFNLKKYVKKS